MRNKKIEILEKRIADLEDSNHKLSDTLDFITLHGKDEIVICLEPITADFPFTRILGHKTIVKYLYFGTIMRVETELCCTREVKIIENSLCIGVLEQGGKYYSLDKQNGTITKIPKPAFVLEKELAEKKATAKKVIDSKKKS